MTSRGSYATGVARRAQIIEAALAQFAATGFHGTSARDIAAQVGISHSGLLRYFPKKEDLLLAVLDERKRRAGLMFVDHTDDPLDALNSVLALVEHNARTRGLLQLYEVIVAESTDPDHPARDYFVEHYRYLRAQFQETFERLQAAGALRPSVTPSQASMALLASWDGLQRQWLLDPDEVDVVRELTRLLQTMLSVPFPASSELDESGDLERD